LTSGIDFADAPALSGYLDDVALHVNDLNDWANILFTDESRFHIDSSDGRSRAYRRVGERYADACVIQRQSFGGGSAMVWGGITALLVQHVVERCPAEM
jgi:hypothetical protein